MIKRHVVFVDPHIDDLETVLAEIRPDTELILLPVDIPPARYMADKIESGRFHSVHILAHGAPGCVRFAAGEWRLATLERDAADHARLGAALAPGGAVHLWCCETAAGAEGRFFVEALEERIGAEVYASALPIGAAEFGGIWRLAGDAASAPPLTEAGLARYAGLLGAMLRISGDIPRDETQDNVTYSVVERGSGLVVSTFHLPGHSSIRRFSIAVPAPEPAAAFDVGVFDRSGAFVPASFAVSRISHPDPAAIGAAGARQ